MDAIRAAVVTVSDTRTRDNDLTGNELVAVLNDAKVDVVTRSSSTDDLEELKGVLESLCDRSDLDLVVTTGGTGFSPRDNTPEATRAVIDREAAGLSEAMRRETAERTPLAMLSRGVCGIRNSVLIINLPGSPKGARECLEVVLPVLGHAIALMRGDKPH